MQEHDFSCNVNKAFHHVVISQRSGCFNMGMIFTDDTVGPPTCSRSEEEKTDKQICRNRAETIAGAEEDGTP